MKILFLIILLFVKFPENQTAKYTRTLCTNDFTEFEGTCFRLFPGKRKFLPALRLCNEYQSFPPLLDTLKKINRFVRYYSTFGEILSAVEGDEFYLGIKYLDKSARHIWVKTGDRVDYKDPNLRFKFKYVNANDRRVPDSFAKGLIKKVFDKTGLFVDGFGHRYDWVYDKTFITFYYDLYYSDVIRTFCEKDFQTVTTEDGFWSRWTMWGKCLPSCGRGTSIRTRACASPPPMQYGRNCTGVGVESQPCSSSACGGGNWALWSDWVQCADGCSDKGMKVRRRSCLDKAGTCTGKGFDTAKCSTSNCNGIPTNMTLLAAYKSLDTTARTRNIAIITSVVCVIIIAIAGFLAWIYLRRKGKKRKRVSRSDRSVRSDASSTPTTPSSATTGTTANTGAKGTKPIYSKTTTTTTTTTKQVNAKRPNLRQ